MKKRQKPKQWYEDRIKELYEGVNNLHKRLYSTEQALLLYIEMKKDDKKLEKFINKKNKENEHKHPQHNTS
jgi:hypothetical protein